MEFNITRIALFIDAPVVYVLRRRKIIWPEPVCEGCFRNERERCPVWRVKWFSGIFNMAFLFPYSHIHLKCVCVWVCMMLCAFVLLYRLRGLNTGTSAQPKKENNFRQNGSQQILVWMQSVKEHDSLLIYRLFSFHIRWLGYASLFLFTFSYLTLNRIFLKRKWKEKTQRIFDEMHSKDKYVESSSIEWTQESWT